MPTERLSMRHIREVLRLHHSVGMSQRSVARVFRLAQGTVSKYLNRTRRAGLTLPLPLELDDDVRLENRLYPPPSDICPAMTVRSRIGRVVHRELRRPGVTLMLLWEEYCDTTSGSFSYSWFCDRYKEWAGRLKPTLRQTHVAGEKLFVDYSGHVMEVIDGLTCRRAAYGADICRRTRRLELHLRRGDLHPKFAPTGSHHMFGHFPFFGGVAQQTVSDNLKAGITRACFHEPMVNRTYADLACHYKTAILPARPYHPRDKAKVEVGVPSCCSCVGSLALHDFRNRLFVRDL